MPLARCRARGHLPRLQYIHIIRASTRQSHLGPIFDVCLLNQVWLRFEKVEYIRTVYALSGMGVESESEDQALTNKARFHRTAGSGGESIK